MGYGPTRQNQGAGNGGEQLVSFKLSDAQRISNVVNEVERSRRGRRGSTLPRAAGGGAGGASVAFTVFSGAWPKGTYKTITIPGAGTASAYNSAANIASATGQRNCAVAKNSEQGPSGNSDEWWLIMAECF